MKGHSRNSKCDAHGVVDIERRIRQTKGKHGLLGQLQEFQPRENTPGSSSKNHHEGKEHLICETVVVGLFLPYPYRSLLWLSLLICIQELAVDPQIR